jgi:hypothetical protein
LDEEGGDVHCGLQRAGAAEQDVGVRGGDNGRSSGVSTSSMTVFGFSFFF